MLNKVQVTFRYLMLNKPLIHSNTQVPASQLRLLCRPLSAPGFTTTCTLYIKLYKQLDELDRIGIQSVDRTRMSSKHRLIELNVSLSSPTFYSADPLKANPRRLAGWFQFGS